MEKPHGELTSDEDSRDTVLYENIRGDEKDKGKPPSPDKEKLESAQDASVDNASEEVAKPRINVRRVEDLLPPAVHLTVESSEVVPPAPPEQAELAKCGGGILSCALAKLPTGIALSVRTPAADCSNSKAPNAMCADTLLSNEAITICRVNPREQGSGVFAPSLPRAPSRPPNSEQPNKFLIVDLTKETPPISQRTPIRPAKRRFVCKICDMTFNVEWQLNEHMKSHRGARANFKCWECRAEYPSKAAHAAHLKAYHAPTELALPVINVAAAGAEARMAQQGITAYVPLQQLHSSGGRYALPVVPLARPGGYDLAQLGMTHLLPLGPLVAIGASRTQKASPRPPHRTP